MNSYDVQPALMCFRFLSFFFAAGADCHELDMLKRVHTTKLMEPSMVITSRGAQIFRIIQIDSEELHRWKLKKTRNYRI